MYAFQGQNTRVVGVQEGRNEKTPVLAIPGSPEGNEGVSSNPGMATLYPGKPRGLVFYKSGDTGENPGFPTPSSSINVQSNA
jgi:hypothetical protein